MRRVEYNYTSFTIHNIVLYHYNSNTNDVIIVIIIALEQQSSFKVDVLQLKHNLGTLLLTQIEHLQVALDGFSSL